MAMDWAFSSSSIIVSSFLPCTGSISSVKNCISKILSAFIPTFKKATPASDGRRYIYGNFNLGGTVSGRLSSSKPNLQQIPATGSKYAKLIKSCFQAPKGWLWVGLDYASLTK